MHQHSFNHLLLLYLHLYPSSWGQLSVSFPSAVSLTACSSISSDNLHLFLLWPTLSPISFQSFEDRYLLDYPVIVSFSDSIQSNILLYSSINHGQFEQILCFELHDKKHNNRNRRFPPGDSTITLDLSFDRLRNSSSLFFVVARSTK